MLLGSPFFFNLLGAEGCLSLVPFFCMEKQTSGFPVETGIADWDLGLWELLIPLQSCQVLGIFVFLPLESWKEIK